MKRLRGIPGLRKLGRTDSRKPLIENNNNNNNDKREADHDTLDGHEDQLPAQMPLQELAQLLGVAQLVGVASTTEALVQRFVSRSFPEAPADLDQNLGRHLVAVQEAVRRQLVKTGPLLRSEGLIQSFHRQTFLHLDDLLQRVGSSHNAFVLMDWVLRSYLSQGLLGHPDLQDMDPVKEVDLLLFTDWTSRAEDKLLQTVQAEISRFLEKILQNEKSQEAQGELHVDTIQCISSMPRAAVKISATLAARVQRVCLQELLSFLTRYTAEQTDFLCKKARMDKPETKPFFQTLNSCKQLKLHLQSEAADEDIRSAAMATLDSMEAFTLKLLMDIVADMAESRLKKHFKSENMEFFLLIDEVKTLFSDLCRYQDVLTRVMDEAYQLLAHVYLKRLVASRASELRRRWHPDVGPAVTQDVRLLHDIVSEMAPGVAQRNLLLLEVEELLGCRDLEATKLTVGRMQEECGASSEELELLPALLRWKGLSGSKIRKVLYGLENLPGFKRRPASWFSCCVGF